ncbi:MAG: bifunctional 3-deoxy-7-phosphoheptulonate synthase/chorismate mutase [Bacillota bacterium]
MIVKMRQGATNDELRHLRDFLTKKGFEMKDVSSEKVWIFGIIGDTASLDPADLRVFEGVEDVIRVQKPFKQVSRDFKANDTVITVKGDIRIGGGNPAIIAGPCSVESHEQLRTIAAHLHKRGVRILRGGAFKPRTSPYTFQGLGLEGLKLLREVADEFDMAVISEIPSADMLEIFESYVDIIQIGARNMQNFHLLKALGGTKKPVMLKRGLSATIEEWLMSAEYIVSSGNENVILCERGIRTFETFTRNTLDLSAVLAVQSLSHLPVIVDPSHAAGRWSMIEKLSKAALSVEADGIMVEVHHKPEEALSDGAQSLKLDTFDTMMDALTVLSAALGRSLK